jgi:hypothetical protein
MSKWFWLGIGLVIGIVAMVGVMSLQPYTLRGSEIDPPIPAPEIHFEQHAWGSVQTE